MAIHLLAALVALGLLHLLPQLARWRLGNLYRRWIDSLHELRGVARIAVALAVPVLLCLLISVLLHHSAIAGLALLVFDLLVLFYSLGPREFEADLEAILKAPDPLAREAAAQLLADSGKRVDWHAHALGEAIAYAALRRRFGVLFWFFVLGPAGALLYRLVQILGRDEVLPMDTDTRRPARHLANALDWLPAQLLTFTLAVVGHWDAVIGAWKRWHQQASRTRWYMDEPGFLADAACADIAVEIQGGDGYTEERSDPLLELVRMRSALLRALLAWLAVVALFVLGGWVD
jgi:AmpE protein